MSGQLEPGLAERPTREEVLESETSKLARPRGVIVNSVVWMASSSLAWVVNAAVVIAAVRTFGVATWGQYATATSLLAIFIAFAQPGVSTLVLRELSASREGNDAELGAALAAVAATSGVAMASIVPAGLVLGYPHQVIVLLAIGALSIFFIGTTEVLRPAFTSRHLMLFGAAFDLAGLAVFGLTAGAILVAGGGPYLLLASSVFGGGVTMICAALLLRRTDLRPRLAAGLRRVVPLIRAAIPLAGVIVVNTIYDRLDIIMLSKLGSSTEVAHYSVVYTLTKFTWVVPTVIITAVYPQFVTQLDQNFEGARDTFFLTFRSLLVIGLPAALFLSLAGHDFLPWFFGSGYSESGDLLAVMAWNTVSVYVNLMLWYGMIALKLERRGLYALGVSLLLNAGLNAVLIPSHGDLGAAISLVAAELFLCVVQLRIIHRHLFHIPAFKLAAVPTATALVAIPLGILTSGLLTPLAGGLLGAVAWLGLLLLARYVTPAELSPLRAALRRGAG